MYSKQFWDELYQAHLHDVPWMSDTHTERHLRIMEQCLPFVEGKTLLDYGCGNGKIAYHFYKMGAKVTLADISDTLVAWLKDEYRESNIEILQAATPFDIIRMHPVRKRCYDILIVGAVFHHVQPDLWNSFLIGFSELVKPSGTMVVSGWDGEDVLFSRTNKAPYTHEPTWPIDDLHGLIIENDLFEIVNEIRYQYTLPEFFNENRTFRYYILRRKNN